MKLIPEWLPHESCCIAWPCNHELYGNVLSEAKIEIANLINEISSDEKVLLFCNPSDLMECRKIVGNSEVDFIEVPLDDSWMRDIAPIFIKNLNQLESICFEFNGYGKYSNYSKDNEIANFISKKLNINYLSSSFVLEGGAITYDDEDNLFTTESVLLNKNRDNNLSKIQYEKELIKLFDIKNIVWLPEGLVGDDTDGHIDNLLCPIGNKKYLLASTDNKEDVNYHILKKNSLIIRDHFIDRVEIIDVPIPDPIILEDKKLVSSYINFYFTENKIILPKFMVYQDAIVRELFSSLFPNKSIIMLDTRSINYGGGNIHCVTMNVPKV
jgi:agmatine deiminase|tara:strand:- start:6757 stop:7734 length:978 start_codon:yes stop_codon:yes gene_type:complete